LTSPQKDFFFHIYDVITSPEKGKRPANHYSCVHLCMWVTHHIPMYTLVYTHRAPHLTNTHTHTQKHTHTGLRTKSATMLETTTSTSSLPEAPSRLTQLSEEAPAVSREAPALSGEAPVDEPAAETATSEEDAAAPAAEAGDEAAATPAPEMWSTPTTGVCEREFARACHTSTHLSTHPTTRDSPSLFLKNKNRLDVNLYPLPLSLTKKNRARRKHVPICVPRHAPPSHRPSRHCSAGASLHEDTASSQKSAHSRSLLPYSRSLLTIVWSTQANSAAVVGIHQRHRVSGGANSRGHGIRKSSI